MKTRGSVRPALRRHQRGDRRHRRAAILLLGLGGFGLAAASAASLGTLTIASLGATNGTVTSCDTNGVTVRYTNAFDTTAHLYATTAVQVRGINAACRGKSLQLTLGTPLAAIGTGTIAALPAGANQTVTLTTPANAKLTTRAAIVVTG